MIVRRNIPLPDPPPSMPSQWPQIIGTFISAVGVTLGIVAYIGGLQLAPINTFEIDAKEHLKEIDLRMAPLLTLSAQIKSDDAAFERLQKSLDSKLDISAHLAYLEATSKTIEDNKSSTIRAAEELSHQVHDLEGKIVSRDENTEHWIETSAQIKSLEDRFNALTLSIETTKDRALIPLNPAKP